MTIKSPHSLDLALTMKVCALLALVTFTATTGHMLTKFAWQELEFSWTSDDQKEDALRNGNYIPANNLPLAFDVWKDKAFFTVPRCVYVRERVEQNL
jgi:hypothetical protein